MKLTKKIEALIDKRTRLAAQLMDVVCEVDCFIRDNEIEVADYDWATGCEIYCNPIESGNRVKQAIINHKEGADDDQKKIY